MEKISSIFEDKELKELDYFAYVDTIQKANAIAINSFKQNINTKEGLDGAYEIEQSLVKMKLLELRTIETICKPFPG